MLVLGLLLYVPNRNRGSSGRVKQPPSKSHVSAEIRELLLRGAQKNKPPPLSGGIALCTTLYRGSDCSGRHFEGRVLRYFEVYTYSLMLCCQKGYPM